jgi:hypothetical protein
VVYLHFDEVKLEAVLVRRIQLRPFLAFSLYETLTVIQFLTGVDCTTTSHRFLGLVQVA